MTSQAASAPRPAAVSDDPFADVAGGSGWDPQRTDSFGETGDETGRQASFVRENATSNVSDVLNGRRQGNARVAKQSVPAEPQAAPPTGSQHSDKAPASSVAASPQAAAPPKPAPQETKKDDRDDKVEGKAPVVAPEGQRSSERAPASPAGGKSSEKPASPAGGKSSEKPPASPTSQKPPTVSATAQAPASLAGGKSSEKPPASPTGQKPPTASATVQDPEKKKDESEEDTDFEKVMADAKEKKARDAKASTEKADGKGANKNEMRTLSSLRRHTMVVDLAAAHEEQEKDEELDEEGLQPLVFDTADWPKEVLQKIQELRSATHARIVDLIRDTRARDGSDHALEDGVLDAGRLVRLMKRAHCSIDMDQAEGVVKTLDLDNDGHISLAELRLALSINHRKHGTDKFHETGKKRALSCPFQPPRSPASKTHPPGATGMDRIANWHKAHKARGSLLRDQKQRQEAVQEQQIEEDIKKARLGTRGKLQPKDLDLRSFLDVRLPEAQRLQKENLESLRKRRAAEENCKVEETRYFAEPLPCTPKVQERDGDVWTRLHEHYNHLMEKRLEDQIIAAVELMQECPIGKEKPLEDTQAISQRLHVHAQEKMKRLEEKKSAHEKKELEDLITNSATKPREGPPDLQRLHQLHEDHGRVQQKREKAMLLAARNEDAVIQKEVESTRAEHQQHRKPDLMNVAARYRQSRSLSPSAARRMLENTPQSAERNFAFAGLPTVKSDDVVLANLNDAVSLRCGRLADDTPLSTLSQVDDLLKDVVKAYRDAAKESDKRGAFHLSRQQPKRLYKDGVLLECTRGWRTIQEPDHLRQLTGDINELLAVAEQAQIQLLQHFGPKTCNQDADSDAEGKPWPEGEKWIRPRNSAKALFAYNPGAKSRKAAERKAKVLYGPSAGDDRYFHVLDYCRVGLVYESANVLEQAIDQICSSFEVVDVRNFYNSNLQCPLGSRWVEIHVVISVGVEVPHVCEIRLEELVFFDTRVATSSKVDRITSMLAQDLCDEGDREAVKYVAQSTLTKPKVSMSYRRFCKRVAARCGSMVGAWRHHLGNDRVLDFSVFRQFLGKVSLFDGVVEYWEALDPTFSSYISIFDFDPEACVLLARLLQKLQRLATAPEHGDDVQVGDNRALMQKWATAAELKATHADEGCFTAKEFKAACHWLGFANSECQKLVEALSSRGDANPSGAAMMVSDKDIQWLAKLHDLVDMDAVLLAKPKELKKPRQESNGAWAHANLLHVLKNPKGLKDKQHSGTVSPMSSPRSPRNVSSNTTSMIGRLSLTFEGKRAIADAPRVPRREAGAKSSAAVVTPPLSEEYRGREQDRVEVVDKRRRGPSSGSGRSRSASPEVIDRRGKQKGVPPLDLGKSPSLGSLFSGDDGQASDVSDGDDYNARVAKFLASDSDSD